jgi:hypothetical protein
MSSDVCTVCFLGIESIVTITTTSGNSTNPKDFDFILIDKFKTSGIENVIACGLVLVVALDYYNLRNSTQMPPSKLYK